MLHNAPTFPGKFTAMAVQKSCQVEFHVESLTSSWRCPHAQNHVPVRLQYFSAQILLNYAPVPSSLFLPY